MTKIIRNVRTYSLNGTILITTCIHGRMFPKAKLLFFNFHFRNGFKRISDIFKSIYNERL